MKSAEEWMSQMSGLNNPPLLTVNRMAIREIQLDAMKEGMRRAAEIAWTAEASVTYDRPVEKMHRDAILSASEQLTEKDL